MSADAIDYRGDERKFGPSFTRAKRGVKLARGKCAALFVVCNAPPVRSFEKRAWERAGRPLPSSKRRAPQLLR